MSKALPCVTHTVDLSNEIASADNITNHIDAYSKFQRTNHRTKSIKPKQKQNGRLRIKNKEIPDLVVSIDRTEQKIKIDYKGCGQKEGSKRRKLKKEKSFQLYINLPNIP
jgi:hypothetical protein